MDPQNSKEASDHKKKYAVIPPNIRMAFIKRVQSKQATIKEASREFGIKFSTSKAILQTYRKEGRVGKKKTRQRKSLTKLEEQEPLPQQVQQVQPAPPEQLVDPILFQQQMQQQQLMMMMMQQPQVLPNTNILEYYNRELEKQRLINAQLWQMLEQKNRNQQQGSIRDFGRVTEEKQYLTPLQSMHNLDNQSFKSLNDGRSTFRDLN
ncbi:hypothetical protein pb186bvf_010925 [Paramecium bursaria]